MSESARSPRTRRPATRPGAARFAATALTAVVLSGCYYHVMGGPALATAGRERGGALVTASSGINGLRGGVGINASGWFFDDQSTGTFGVEAFRLWRGEAQRTLQPYVRGAVGVLELGLDADDLLFGGLSPRGELGVMWFPGGFSALTLGAAAEYRPRGDGLSTPVFWLQLGVGGFDFLDSSSRAEARDE